MNENAKKLYDALVGAGVSLGDYNTYSSKIQDPANRKKLFDAATGAGVSVGDFATFEQKLGFQSVPQVNDAAAANEVYRQNARESFARKEQEKFAPILSPFSYIAKKLGGNEVGGSLVDKFSPVPAIAQAVQTIASIPDAPDTKTAVSRAGLGLAQSGMGALNLMNPALFGVFGAGTEMIGQVSPDVGKAIEAISNPVMSLTNPQTEIGQNAARSADIGIQSGAYKFGPKAIRSARQTTADALSKSAFKIPPSINKEARTELIRTSQKYNIGVTDRGVDKIDARVGELKRVAEGLEKQAIDSGTASISTRDLVDSIDPLIEKWSKSDTPQEFIRILENYKRKVVDQQKPELSLQESIDLKRNLQKQLVDVYQKAMKVNPSLRSNLLKDAKSEIEQTVRAKLEEAIPGYADVNSKIHKLLKLKPFVEQAASRISNQDLAKVKWADLAVGGLTFEVTSSPYGGIAAAVVGRILTDPRVQAWMGNKIAPKSPVPSPLNTIPTP